MGRGAEAFDRLTAAFYDKVLADPVVGPVFAGMDRAHPAHVAQWLGEVFGGPDLYTRERGGYAHMLAMHRDRSITEPQRRRWVELLLDAADDVGLPLDPEFRAAFVGYIEWAPGWRWRTPDPAHTRSSRRRCHAGAGVSLRRTTV